MYILEYMKTKIQKWGNSLGVRLPKNITEQKNLTEGRGVSIIIKNNQIVIEPIADETTLNSLLAAVTVDNVHVETDWGEAQGKEVW